MILPSRSLPSRERGLKYQKKLPTVESDHVAPLAGARIEIIYLKNKIRNDNVAPLAGARIEILLTLFFFQGDGGRSPRGSAD